MQARRPSGGGVPEVQRGEMRRSSSEGWSVAGWAGGVALAVASVGAMPASAAAPHLQTSDNAALRRACATGALTAYACARRGITSAPTPAAGAQPPAAAGPTPDVGATASPPAAAAPPATPPAPLEVSAQQAKRPAPAEAARSIRPFRDAKGRYDFEIPEGWELVLRGGLTTFTHGDAWMQLRSTTSMEVRGDAALQLLRGEYDGFQQGQDGAVNLGGRPGRRQTLTARSKGGRPSALVVVSAAMSPTDEFVLIAGADPQYAGDIDAGVSAVMKTLHFR